MTEKRFTIKTVEEDCIFDNQDCKYYDELNMTIELLNELWEELVELTNKQIKSVEENEQLKKELRNLRRLANELYMEGSEWLKND